MNIALDKYTTMLCYCMLTPIADTISTVTFSNTSTTDSRHVGGVMFNVPR